MTDLERLPQRITAVESQVVQLRTEMRDEFSAVRGEMKDMRESLRTEIAETGAALRAEMNEMGAALREEIADTRQSLGGQIDQLGREMRVLHEDVIGRLAVIQEGQSSRRRRNKPKRA